MLAPIKAFYTKDGTKAGMTWPEATPQTEKATASKTKPAERANERIASREPEKAAPTG